MKIELLAPAGNKESFMSAVNAGANAVYAGLKNFSARSKAQNFSRKEFYNLCIKAKEKNVKVYGALNTLISQKDIPAVFEELQFLSLCADAVIVQDIGAAGIIKKYFPDLRMHASTQLAVHNSFGVKQAEQMGFSRVVLARESSFDEIKHIKQNTNCELEIFCHGALCFCVSGLCLFSSFIGGHSGNRGLCTQPCRRLWDLQKRRGYFLSPKDLQLAQYVEELKKSGITSLKIEGRMKNASYVYKTVKAYKTLIDATPENAENALKEALNILAYDYARQKTTFNFKVPDKNIFEPEKSKNTGFFAGNVGNIENGCFFIDTDCILEKGNTIRIVDKKNDRSETLKIKDLVKSDTGYIIGLDGIYAQKGFEVFKITESDITFESPDISANIPDLKKMNMHSCQFKNNNFKIPELFIRINNVKWLDMLDNSKYKIVFSITKNNICDLKRIKNKSVDYFELPDFIEENRIMQFSETVRKLLNEGYEKFFINNISHFVFFEKAKVSLSAGQFLYVLNSYAAEYLQKFNVGAFTVSWEDDMSNIFEMPPQLKNRMIVYISGFPKLAVSKMIFSESVKNSEIKTDLDEFRIISSEEETIIIPKYPVMLFDLKHILKKNGINSFGIDLSYVKPDKNYIDINLKAFYGHTNLNSRHKFNFARKLK